MGIFSSGESKDGTLQPESNPVQSRDVLGLLNLSPQDRESYQHSLISKESTQNGINYYKEHANNITSAPEVNIGELTIPARVSDKSDLVDAIYTQIEQQREALQNLDPEKVKLIMVHLKAFAEGYAQGAIDAKDWKTALKSFDRTTEGGIIQRPDVIKQLADAFKGDTLTRNQMADEIEKLLAKRSKTDAPKAPEILHTIALTPTTEQPRPVPNPVITPTPSFASVAERPSPVPTIQQSQAMGPLIGSDGRELRPAPPPHNP